MTANQVLGRDVRVSSNRFGRQPRRGGLENLVAAVNERARGSPPAGAREQEQRLTDRPKLAVDSDFPGIVDRRLEGRQARLAVTELGQRNAQVSDFIGDTEVGVVTEGGSTASLWWAHESEALERCWKGGVGYGNDWGQNAQEQFMWNGGDVQLSFD